MMRFTPLPSGPPGSPVTTFVWTTPARRTSVGRHLGNWGLTLLAALGVACVAATLACAALGVTALRVRSGSMAPAIPAGSVVFTQEVPATELRVGDVISVTGHDGGRVTHRIHSIEAEAGAVHRMILQGDANALPDRDALHASSAERVVLSVPWAGRALDALGTTAAQFGLGLLCGVALWWTFAPPSVHQLGRWVPERRDRRKERR